MEQELRAVMGLPVLSAVVQTPIGIASPSVPPPPPSAESNVADMQQKYLDLFGKVSAAISAGKLTMEQVTKVCQAVGIQGMPLLPLRLDLVPNVAQMIDGLIQAQA